MKFRGCPLTCAWVAFIGIGLASHAWTAGPTAVEKHWGLAKAYLARGMRYHAVEEARVVLRLAPDHPGAQELLAAHGTRRPKTSSAVPLEDIEPATLMTEAQRAYRESRQADAKRLAEDTLREDPANEEASRILHNLREERYRSSPLEADELLRKLFEEGMVLYRRERWEAAAEVFQKALVTSPSHEQLWTYFNRSRTRAEERSVIVNLSRAREAIAAGRKAEAKTALRKVLQVDPNHAEALELLRQLGIDPREAARLALIRKHFNRGAVAYEQGLWADAVREWEIVMELDPKDARTLKLLGKARDKEEAAWKAAQERIQGLHARALRLYQTGKLEEAAGLYREILLLDANDFKARRGLELIQEKSVVR